MAFLLLENYCFASYYVTSQVSFILRRLSFLPYICIVIRPGRIEKHIFLDYPTAEDKEDILKIYIRNYEEVLKCNYKVKSDSDSNVIDGSNGGVSNDAPDYLKLEKEQQMDAIKEIACSQRSNNFTATDLKAIIDAAYLKSVQESIASKISSSTTTSSTSTSSSSSSSSSCGGASNFVNPLSGRALLAAFARAQPSLTPADAAFYDRIYRQFNGSKASYSEGGKGPSDDVLNQKSTLM